MRTRFRPLRRAGAVLGVGLALAMTVAAAPAASADTADPPRFDSGFGLTVVSQPAWADDAHRTFTFAVTSGQVPNPTLVPGQTAGQHVIMVTLPEGYDGAAATRYPVLYGLHGNRDLPNTVANLRMTEDSTRGVPLITVWPNGVRSWYSNWVNPGSLGPQNWETFHLDQLIPLIDANLKTIPAREGRAIVGHSMGGFGAFHYAEHRPDLFSYVGSFSGGLDLLNQGQRAAVVETELDPASGTPTTSVDAIFGPPVWPLDGVWNAESPAQHVSALRDMGVAMYTGNGGNLTVDPVQAVVENGAEQTAKVTAGYLTAAGIPFQFTDYGDGSGWATGCTGKHAQFACLQADMDHFIPLIMQRLRHP
ncbi:alpha/beta hydrolase-fold protein [Amycolatopsis cynarae]|uniref:Alpha/beta hydrolase-fold protein n=1 Tax=Amycolatopsis cynarae TaxID=2995223 RepID=A0ABY7AXA5_9PSEU|nr:alpha/beta hydrolase-fold protein [Amycolatopsis sp. HUAS 11-8]WAL64650.1 alpha/beta hydrolase-fold protein [Amycolatopsis sp. HUAS 11-8]